MIGVENLSVSYGGHRAVEEVTLSVPEGGSFALVGESGSGKSTVLKAIAGLAAEWEGRISLDGHPVSRRSGRSAARLRQMVFQDPYGSLHPRRTVDATLSEPLAVHGIGGQDDRVKAALKDVGLDHRFRFRYPHQLSGGQRQRVAIARALILEPRILLLDEPTSALDVSIQAGILNLLKRLRAERALTYLLVTHNLPVVGFLCDGLAIMRRGRIVETTRSAALRSGAFETAYARHLFAATGGDLKGTEV